MRIVGIDPGLSGGIAIIEKGAVELHPMPIAGKDLHLAHLCVLLHGCDIAVVERVSAMPKQGVVSMFNFGKSFGGVLGVLAAMGIQTELVSPQSWRKAIGVQSGKGPVADWAARRYPNARIILPGCRKPHEGMVDALAIAHYGDLHRDLISGAA